MRNLHLLTYTLIIIGALNWGLVGFFGFDLVAFLFGDMTAFSRIIYSLVGLSAVTEIILSAQHTKLAGGYAH
ncbi:MAG TPA: DUF378 domain-containing protein [Cyanobacteria bacterium UBA9971]|nr:DUF378 domain-containing protein [Cyanobacteria bacterium UBA9971]